MLFKEKFEREKNKEVKNKRRKSRKSEEKGNTSRDTIVSVIKVSIEFLDGKYLKVLPFFLRSYLFFFHILVYQQIHVLRSYSIILLSMKNIEICPIDESVLRESEQIHIA